MNIKISIQSDNSDKSNPRMGLEVISYSDVPDGKLKDFLNATQGKLGWYKVSVDSHPSNTPSNSPRYMNLISI